MRRTGRRGRGWGGSRRVTSPAGAPGWGRAPAPGGPGDRRRSIPPRPPRPGRPGHPPGRRDRQRAPDARRPGHRRDPARVPRYRRGGPRGRPGGPAARARHGLRRGAGPLGPGCARRPRGSGAGRPSRQPAHLLVPGVDLALGPPGRRTGPVGAGGARFVAALGRRPQTRRHPLLRQPAGAPGSWRRPRAHPGHRGSFHPRSRGAAAGGGPMSLGPGYFDQMYAAADDPWGLATRWYETRKYALTMALLPDPHYQDAFEPGCSVGVLTGMLASRCGQLLAWDASRAAVRAAAARTAGLPNVCVRRGAIPGDWPAGQFDLIVFSEVLYYFSGRELDRGLDRASAALRPGGSLLAGPWRHPLAASPRSGDDVHQVLPTRRDLARRVGHTETDFTAEVYQRAGRELLSVAQAEGLA